MRLLALGVIAAIAFATTGARVEAMRVPLTVREWSGIARAHEPVTAGVPFAPGALRDVSALAALDKAADAAHADKVLGGKEPEEFSYWQLGIYLRALGRYVDTAALVDGKAPARAADSLVKYARAMAKMREKEGGGPWKSPTTWASDAFMMAARYAGSEADRARLVKLAGEAFDYGWRQYIEGREGYVYWNAKTTTMTFTGGGEWMWHRSQQH